jgi:kumamolisin
MSQSGYDTVTGLGSPSTYNLAQNLLAIQSRATPG